ncbi:WcaA Glycosyltransferases involved in cell wall biogenesis [Candidatus Methylopumilus planktonicus]|uniref:glycosyltransferase family 2 protein n=1 Tax=Candidatus Methylopumilus planktonicus TaxID=1581557 RepID=UPI003BEED137
MRKNSFFTLIIATKNCTDSIEKCLFSIFNQTYQNFELVVIDGKSNDGTYEILQSSSNKISYLISEYDSGIAEAWNKAIRNSNGRWVFFLGGDDFLNTPFVLEAVHKFLIESDNKIKLVYGSIDIYDHNRKIKTEGSQWDRVKKKFNYYMAISHQSIFFNRTLFDEFGLFDVKYKIAADYDFMLKVLRKYTPEFMSQIIICSVSMGGLSNNFKNISSAHSEFSISSSNNRTNKHLYYIIYLRIKVLIKFTCKSISILFSSKKV